MDMTGEYRIPARREDVWQAMNDPEVLKKAIPGCQSLEKISDTEMTAKVVSKIGPVKATFNGHVTLSDIDPPKGYHISGEGKGGVAGFAKGGADVHLAEDGEETVLTYEAKAQVGGKLAQLGSRMIDSTAKKTADEFFANISAHFTGGQEAEEGEGALEHAVHEMEDVARDAEEKLEVAAGRGYLGGPIAWGFAAVGVLILVILILS
ncbi:SRPBCC family protein [Rhodobium gokarnense]|uniref:Carbon monoxide dehydrogenase subunit G n=1 Tax=Rhodobium gokarnense TaxID=364296 RepID=A0ABT3HGM6_9HYPH|nr:carbon monoxide dehydrogenase subunit G [Rhodobium gokarnense]MCW2309555.1 carbon monoxide dehydrogenase subunit G [Rhodobium gokarnense]